MDSEAILSKSNYINIMDKLLTIQDIAKTFDVHPKTVINWQSKGLLPEPVRIGTATVRYLESDIQTLMEKKGIIG